MRGVAIAAACVATAAVYAQAPLTLYVSATDAEAMAAFDLLCKTEGIIPAIESAHALAGALNLAKELGPDSTILVNLSGRGDKDVETAGAYFGLLGEEGDA